MDSSNEPMVLSREGPAETDYSLITESIFFALLYSLRRSAAFFSRPDGEVSMTRSDSKFY